MRTAGTVARVLRAAVSVSAEQAFARDIAAAWSPVHECGRQVVEAVIETGRRLVNAKADLDHGQWQRMFRHGADCNPGCTHLPEPLPFSPRTARRLMQIARHPVISNRSHATGLPADFTTLASLTRIPEPRLLAAIEDGTVNASMTRAEVAALREPRPPRPEPEPSERAFKIAWSQVDRAIAEALRVAPSDRSKADLFRYLGSFGRTRFAEFVRRVEEEENGADQVRDIVPCVIEL